MGRGHLHQAMNLPFPCTPSLIPSLPTLGSTASSTSQSSAKFSTLEHTRLMHPCILHIILHILCWTERNEAKRRKEIQHSCVFKQFWASWSYFSIIQDNHLKDSIRFLLSSTLTEQILFWHIHS
jgi:hypothetical protein